MSYKLFLQLKKSILKDINSNNSFEQFLQFKNAIIKNSDNEITNSDASNSDASNSDASNSDASNSNSSNSVDKRKSPNQAHLGFLEFIKFKKAIAETLEISNGPKAGCIAGKAQKEIKEKNPDLKDIVKISEMALELVKANPNKYRDMKN